MQQQLPGKSKGIVSASRLVLNRRRHSRLYNGGELQRDFLYSNRRRTFS